MQILVTGANGYIGVHLILYLTRQGHRVTALVRPGCEEKELALLKELGAAIVENDLTGNSRLSLSPNAIEAVIHLLGSVVPPKEGTFRSVHESKTRVLTSECRKLGVKKLVYLGTLGAASDGPNDYYRSKWLAEEEIRSSGIDYVIVRSPLVFGKSFGMRESKVIRRLRETMQSRPKIPILGNGQNLLQPIYVGDLVHCLEKAARDAGLRNVTVDVGGPEKITFEALLDALAAKARMQKKKLKIPLPIAHALAWIFARMSAKPPFTPDDVRMMQRDVVCKNDKMNEVFGPSKVRLQDGL